MYEIDCYKNHNRLQQTESTCLDCSYTSMSLFVCLSGAVLGNRQGEEAGKVSPQMIYDFLKRYSMKNKVLLDTSYNKSFKHNCWYLKLKFVT